MQETTRKYPLIHPLTTPLLRRITKDWLSLLPGFGFRGVGDLNKRVGPLLISISTARSGRGSDTYYPLFSVNNFASPSDFLFISLGRDLPRGNGKRNHFYAHQHDAAYKESVEKMKAIAPIPLLEPLTLEDIFQGYVRYMEEANEGDKYFISQLEGPALIAAWAGEPEKAKEYLEWADGIFRGWREYTRTRFGGDQWRPSLEKRISEPEKLRQICREEVIKHKCEKVPYYNIVGVRYQEPVL